jgi:thiol-disulfide isomerase/thioredoxin
MNRRDVLSFRILGGVLAFVVAFSSGGSARAIEGVDIAAEVRSLREERARRTREAAPAQYAAIDADLAARAGALLDRVDVARLPPGEAADGAALATIARRHADARDLLRRYLTQPLDGERRSRVELDYMLALVALNDGEEIYRVLRTMAVDAGNAVTLGSYFGGTFHHYVLNAKGPRGCLEIIDRILPALPAGPFASDEIRRSNGWARRQLAATRALYLSESGKRDEAVRVLDEALAALDDDIFRKDGLRGDRQRILLLNHEAPEIRVDRMHGRFAGLESLRGRVVLLEFTAHWCHACHAALPALQRLQQEFGPRGLEFVALTTYYGFFGADRARTKDMPKDEEFARMPAMLEKQAVTWPMVYTDRETMAAYGVTGIPQIMLLDRKGRVRKIDLGFSEAKMERFRQEIRELLEEASS